jgi:hypothetical protein
MKKMLPGVLGTAIAADAVKDSMVSANAVPSYVVSVLLLRLTRPSPVR